MFDCEFIAYVFDHRITLVLRFDHIQFPTIRRSDGVSVVIFCHIFNLIVWLVYFVKMNGAIVH